MSDNDNSGTIEGLQETRERLAKISPSFCAAKWLQLTLHLHNGNTHSCHHPDTHQVPLAELKDNPSALHNTKLKKQYRRQMLTGKRPKECDYCWRIEDSSSRGISDRLLKSNDAWARPDLENLAQLPWDADVDPTYLELSFSSTCNMKCSYCLPHISSSWMKEIVEFGPYPSKSRTQSIEATVRSQKMPLPHDSEINPYVQAFWKWWPDLKPKLKVLRLTGGEPLLDPNTFRLLESLEKESSPEMDLGVNSNLMVPKARVDRFIESAQRILAAGNVKKLSVFTSIDAGDDRAEYIRHGLRSEYFWANVEHVAEALPEAVFSFMVTFNALSVTSFTGLLDRFLKLRTRFPKMWLDVSYLRDPIFLSVKVLTSDYVPQVADIVQYMEDRPCELVPGGFYKSEIEKMRRLYDWMMVPESEAWLAKARPDFYAFFNEHDRRRGTVFTEVFPEMRDFWRLCRNLHQHVENESFSRSPSRSLDLRP